MPYIPQVVGDLPSDIYLLFRLFSGGGLILDGGARIPEIALTYYKALAF